MFTINTVTLSGNLTRDPERIGDKGAKFGLAVNERVKKGDTWEDYASFIDVVAWGSLGEQVMKQLSKGSPVGIQGRLKQDRWETDAGEKRSKVDVVAFAMFAPKASDAGNGARYEQSDVPPDTSGVDQSGSTQFEESIPF